MRYEKTITREDKSRVGIKVGFWIKGIGNNPEVIYDISVFYCPPRKRTFTNVVDTNNGEYRQQTFPEGRIEWQKRKQLEFVTPEEILEAKMELWNKLKPTL